jgi:hypothetical protein
MASTQFDVDLANYLATNLAAWTFNTNLFAGPLRPVDASIPAQAVFCESIGGLPGDGYCGETDVMAHGRVLITVRYPGKEFSDGLAAARAIWSQAYYAEVAGYFETKPTESDPTPMGEGDENLLTWTINVDMWRRVDVNA